MGPLLDDKKLMKRLERPTRNQDEQTFLVYSGILGVDILARKRDLDQDRYVRIFPKLIWRLTNSEYVEKELKRCLASEGPLTLPNAEMPVKEEGVGK
jgi:hypothetical protein